MVKWILFELIYGVVWAIFGFRVLESGADLCHCLSIFFGLKGHDFGGGQHFFLIFKSDLFLFIKYIYSTFSNQIPFSL